MFKCALIKNITLFEKLKIWKGFKFFVFLKPGCYSITNILNFQTSKEKKIVSLKWLFTFN